MDSGLSTAELARRKLIIAAIELFAENGVDSVTLRMINRRAGQKNNSALHYHFGSKLKLIESVDEFIQAHFDAAREAELARLERQAKEGDVALEEVLEAFVDPYVKVISENHWGYSAVRTLARMEFDANEDVQRLLNNSAGRAVKRTAKLMRPLLPHLSARTFRMRHMFIVNSTIRGFADYRNLHVSYLGDLTPKSLRELSRFYISMCSAVLRAPS